MKNDIVSASYIHSTSTHTVKLPKDLSSSPSVSVSCRVYCDEIAVS